jgi:hypothetical protein
MIHTVETLMALADAYAQQWPFETNRNARKELYAALTEALAQQSEPKCNPHAKAPHGFNRNSSHAADHYVCDCEGWDAWEAGYSEGMEAGSKIGEYMDASNELQDAMTAPQAAQPVQEQEPATSDEWLANCPQEVRDFANKLKAAPKGEQEPVAWAVVGEGGYDRLDGHKQFIGLSIQKPVTFFGSTAMPLYAAPQGAPKPLTNEQIKEGYLEHDLKYAFVSSAWSFTAGVEFAEAAHGIGGLK